MEIMSSPEFSPSEEDIKSAEEGKTPESYFFEPMVEVNNRFISSTGKIDKHILSDSVDECRARIKRAREFPKGNPRITPEEAIDLLDKLAAIQKNTLSLQSEAHEITKRRADMLGSDELTGLPRNIQLEDRQREIIKNLEENEVILIAVIDINKLKTYNDYFEGGHSAGDSAIKAIAEALKTVSGDPHKGYTAKMKAGDEFIIFRSVAAEDIDQVKEDIVEALKELYIPMKVKGGHTVYDQEITASVGFSVSIDNEDINIADMTIKADEKMYEEKS